MFVPDYSNEEDGFYQDRLKIYEVQNLDFEEKEISKPKKQSEKERVYPKFSPKSRIILNK